MEDFVPPDEYVEELDAFLTSTGFAVDKLPGGVAGLVRAYLMTVDVGLTVGVIKALTPDLVESLIHDAEEHLGRSVSRMAGRVAVQWWCSRERPLADRNRERDERDPAAAGQAAGGLGAGLAFGFGGAEGDINDLESVMGAPLGQAAGAPAPTRAIAGLYSQADLLAHGTLDPILLLILTGVLVSGVLPSREAAKVCMALHNSDWRVSPHMASQRKAKIPSFWDVMAKHSYVELEAYWQEAVNALSDCPEFHKCALMANQAWSAVVQSMGTGDGAAKAIGDYWWEYLTKRYRGRGIPVVLDTSLVLKYRQATPADVQQASKQQLELETMRAELGEMKLSMERQAEALRHAGKPRPGGEETGCWVCGKEGHRKPQCPVWLASEAGKKAKAAKKKAAAAAGKEADDEE